MKFPLAVEVEFSHLLQPDFAYFLLCFGKAKIIDLHMSALGERNQDGRGYCEASGKWHGCGADRRDADAQ